MIHDYPRSQIYQRVMAITPDKKSVGSALAYPIKKRHCLITAAHVVKENMPEGKLKEIFLYEQKGWVKSEATAFYCDEGTDVAIIDTPIPSSDQEKLPLKLGGEIIFGQDLYFLGFPYFESRVKYPAVDFNSGYPLPFVKKGTFSAVDHPLIYFSGHNNPGFSGGPIVFWDHKNNEQAVLGVISGYVTHKGEIHQQPTNTQQFYLENSGIAVGYSSRMAINLIKKVYGVDLLETKK